mgnify:CR=1 FL=1
MSKVCVAISCYNQEKYIEECICHLLSQKYEGECIIKICDDASTDSTKTIIWDTVRKLGLPKGWTIEECSNKRNMGMPANTKRILKLLMDSGANYGCILEGDDYWISPFWLEKHVKDMDADENISMTNNYLLFFHQNANVFSVRQYPDKVQKSRYILPEMQAEDNYTGNFSSSLYRVASMKKIPQSFLEQPYVDDWFVNLLMSQQGKIRSIKEPLSVYRIHEQSVWNGGNSKKRINKMESTILKRIHFMHCHYPGMDLEELSEFSARWAQIPIKGRIYYNLGKGYAEENSVPVYTMYDDKAHFTAHIVMPVSLGRIKELRYDPEEGYPCKVKGLRIIIDGIAVEAIPENGRRNGDITIFETTDPIYKLKLPKSMKKVNEIEIEGYMSFE